LIGPDSLELHAKLTHKFSEVAQEDEIEYPEYWENTDTMK